MSGQNAAVANRTGTIYAAQLVAASVVEDTADTWNETVTTGVTLSTTTTNGATTTDPISPPKGTTVARAVCASVASGAIIMSEVLTSTDLSGDAAVTFYFRSSVALAASKVRLLLDSGVVAGDGSDLEDIDFPAIPAANTWYRVMLRLNDPSQATAIVSIGLAFATGYTVDATFDIYQVRKLAEVEGLKSYSVPYNQSTLDTTDYQSGATMEYLKSYKDWTMTLGGHKESAPGLAMEADYVIAVAESSTVGQVLIGDGFLTNFTDSGAATGLVEYAYTVRGTGALQLPIA